MKVGYLHLVPEDAIPESGVTRYGRLLATTARCHPGLQVIEAELWLPKPPADPSERLREISTALNSADVVHLQYSKFIWGPPLQQYNLFKTLFSQLRIPTVLTLHDLHGHLYPNESWLPLLIRENYRQRARSRFKSGSLRSTWQQVTTFLADRRTLQFLLQSASQVLTCHQQEKERLAHLRGFQQIQVIPHFVESRHHSLSPQAAKQKLGFTADKIITLQGFIHRTKGHHLAIEALALLPEPVHLLFAGGAPPGGERILQELHQLAESLGVNHRLKITGYLTDDEMTLHLLASDLAVCPFQTLSASGSLSTWIALHKPILASDLPQIQDYNDLVPNAIQTFSPYSAIALSTAIKSQLMSSQIPNASIIALQEHLSLSRIVEQHQAIYSLQVETMSESVSPARFVSAD